VYVDFNGNGRFDAGVDTDTATDSGGNYTLHVAPGTYTVRFHPTADSLVQSPFDPGQSITVVAGQLVTGVNFSELVV